MPENGALDLATISEASRIKRRFPRFVGAAVAGLCALVAIALLLADEAQQAVPQTFSTSNPTWYYEWILFAALLVLIGFGVWAGVVLGSPGAVAVRVDDDALGFVWRSGRVTRLPWASRRFRVDLWVVGKADSPSEVPEVAARAKLWLRPATELSEEAFQHILEAAVAHGLRVQKRRWHGLFARVPVSTIMIRSRAG